MTRILGHVRRKMLRNGLPAVLNDLDEDGRLRPGSTLRPMRNRPDSRSYEQGG